MVLVGGPASLQFSGVYPTREESIRLCQAHFLCHSAPSELCVVQCPLFGQEGASAASPVFFLPLELRPGKAQEVVEQERTFPDPQQDA